MEIGGVEALGGKGNIRYWGANPNNYIYFNCTNYNNQSSSTCELWRIIGEFDGKMKIIRKDSITDGTMGGGSLLWDSGGSNDWVRPASLNTYLNGTYYNSLKNDATKKKIASVTWNLGMFGLVSLFSVYPNNIYSVERGTGPIGAPATWSGNIALIYPSDYTYAADFRYCDADLSKYNNCCNNDWLCRSGQNWLTISPDYHTEIFLITSSGEIGTGLPNGLKENIFPVLFLNSTEMIKSGHTGSSTDPYQLAS